MQSRYARSPETPFGLVVEGLAIGEFEAGPQRLDVRGGADLGLGLRLATPRGRW